MPSWTWFSLLAVVLALAYVLLHRRRSQVTDPVCGMKISIARAQTIRHGAYGPIYLCSQTCTATFDEEPERYGGVRPFHGGHVAC